MAIKALLAVVPSIVLLPTVTSAQYTRTDLVTNSGEGGTVQDPHLVNAWGLVSTAASPFWVSDNATGLSTLYSIGNTNGVRATTVGLVVSVPSATGAQGTPTGIVAPETPAASRLLSFPALIRSLKNKPPQTHFSFSPRWMARSADGIRQSGALVRRALVSRISPLTDPRLAPRTPA